MHDAALRAFHHAMFTIASTHGKARAGELATASGPLATPGLLVATHRGGVLNLTPDLLEKLGPAVQGVQLDVLQFLTQPKPEVLRGCAAGGRAFLALDSPGWVLVATARDPAVYEYTGAMRKATDEWASVSIHSGAATVTPAQYVEDAAAIGPDIWVALSDDVPSDSRSDRAAKAVDRTAAWLKQCLEAAAQAPGLPGLAGAAAWAAVQGGQYVQQRVRCAELVAAQAGVSGFVIAGLGTGESPEQRAQIVEAVAARLPPAAPRMLSSACTPVEVLEAVAQGIDLFDCAYIAGLVAGGYALTFPVSPEEEAAQQAADGQAAGAGAAGAGGQQPAAAGAEPAGAGQAGEAPAAPQPADSGQDDTKMSLWALAHRTDRRPLVPGCGCLTCGSHSRAYIHHLLQAHEMTAQVLLELHNTHHYLRFFQAVRASIQAGRFEAYRAWFLERRQRWLLEGR